MLNNLSGEIGIIIISRLKSKRLRNKAILKINKKYNLTEYLIQKLKKNFKFKIVLSTSRNKKDYKLVKIAKKNNISYYTGEAIDVLKRIYNAAIKYKFKNVLICSGDNPLIDIKIAKKMIKFHLENKSDYTNTLNLPLGSYGWIIKVESIEKILKKKVRKDTEIWGDFFVKNEEIKYKTYVNSKNFEIYNLRLTIDEKKDLKFIKQLLIKTKSIFPSFEEIKKTIKSNPKLLLINKDVRQRKGPKSVY